MLPQALQARYLSPAGLEKGSQPFQPSKALPPQPVTQMWVRGLVCRKELWHRGKQDTKACRGRLDVTYALGACISPLQMLDMAP